MFCISFSSAWSQKLVVKCWIHWSVIYKYAVASSCYYCFPRKSLFWQSPKHYHVWPLPFSRPAHFTFPQTLSVGSILIFFSLLHLALPNGLFPSGFRTQVLYMLHVFSVHTEIPVCLALLYLIILKILGEDYRLWGFYPCTVKPLLSDTRSSDSRINWSNFNQVSCNRFLLARVC